jgi:hypothetical protein
MGEYLWGGNYVVFNRIFAADKYRDVLIRLLRDCLAPRYKIRSITILRPSSHPVASLQRPSVLDVLWEDTQGNKFITMIGFGHSSGFLDRAQYYANKTYIEPRENGRDYQDVKEFIFLGFLFYIHFKDDEWEIIIRKYTPSFGEKQEGLNDFSFTLVEVAKTVKQKYLYTYVDLSRWIKFFVAGS